MDPSPSTWWRSQPSIAPQLTIPGSCEPGLATVAGPSTERDRHVTRDADTFVPSTAGEARDVLAEQQVIVDDQGDELYYRTYRSEREDMEGIMRLVDQELSEPYVLFPFTGLHEMRASLTGIRYNSELSPFIRRLHGADNVSIHVSVLPGRVVSLPLQLNPS